MQKHRIDFNSKWLYRFGITVGGESSRIPMLRYNDDRVEIIEISCFNSVILYKFYLYKYKRRVYILTQIIIEVSHEAGHGYRKRICERKIPGMID